MTNNDIVSQDFNSLVSCIQNTSDIFQQDARLVINRNVTTRAWLIGFYIVEYEQHGSDRAKYGDKLLKRLVERLDNKSFSLTNLKNFRSFYLFFPQLGVPIGNYLANQFGKSQTASDFLQDTVFQLIEKSQTVSDLLPESEKNQSLISLSKTDCPQFISRDGFAMQTINGEVLPVPQMAFDRLPFSHFTLLIHINDPLKRAFYAIQAMRGPWSYRELQRQIDSNYYERSGWSKKPELLAQKVNDNAEKSTFRQELKSHYVFEFSGLAAKDTIEEDVLEQSLIDNLEEFMWNWAWGSVWKPGKRSCSLMTTTSRLTSCFITGY